MINQYSSVSEYLHSKLIPAQFALIVILFLPVTLLAQNSALRVDLDLMGRHKKEVNERGYQYWPIGSAKEISKTFGNVTITFSNVGNNGTGLHSDFY